LQGADDRLLTIYDLAVEARWEGKVGEEEIKGTVKVPEVSHEAIDGLSDYEVSRVSASSTEARETDVEKQRKLTLVHLRPVL